MTSQGQNTPPVIDMDEGNLLHVEEGSKFTLGRINVRGSGNSISIGQALHYNQLVISIRGDNKTIKISNSSRTINFLKIISTRGDNQSVEIGKNFSCGGLEIQMNDGDEAVTIGDNCLFSWGIKIRTSDGHSIVDLTSGLAINLPRDVRISPDVWVSEDCRFLKGARIPSNVVVGSAAVVTKEFSDSDSYTIIGGFPAKVMKRNVTWDYSKAADYNARRNS